MSILGNRVLRREDPALLTSGGTYVDDVDVPGAAFVTYVRSTMAHARLTEIDVSEAESMPGVLAVVTAADVDLADQPPATPTMDQAMTRPLLARDVVRFVGEPIVAIVTEERGQGPDAAEAVFVDYEPLPAVVDPERALDGEVRLFAGAESNVVWRIEARSHVADFSACEAVVSQRMVNQRVAPSPIEGRVAVAWWSDDGRLTQYQSCQGAHPVRDALAALYGLDKADVRVVCPDVGGSFGAKAGSSPELLLLGFLARRVGSAGALVRVPHREHDRHGSRTGPDPGRHHRRQPRRAHHRLQARGPAGCRRLPGHGRAACRG